jgi:hypothetical protein
MCGEHRNENQRKISGHPATYIPNCGRVWGFGGGGTWGNETPPGGLAGTGRIGVKTGVKKTKTEDAVAERRTCFAEGEQSKCNQTGKKKSRTENASKTAQKTGKKKVRLQSKNTESFT